MQKLKNSILIKIVLLFLSFGCGFFSAYESYQLISYYDLYSDNVDTVEQTQDFGSLYLKYLQRVCVYVKHREAGFVNDPTSIYSSTDLVSVLTGTAEGNLRPSNSVYEFTQDSFEYYNRLINIDCKNFFYYVKNIDTGATFYSPHFSELLKQKSSNPDMTIEDYLKGISKEPSYLLLSTNNSLFSTNITPTSFYSSENSSISWCINFLNEYFPTESEFDSEVTLESSSKINHYMVYTFYDSSFCSDEDEFTKLKSDFEQYYQVYKFAKISCPISLALCFLFALLYLACAGHKENVDGIYLTLFDRWYAEIAIGSLGLMLFVFYFILQIIEQFFNRNPIYFYMSLYVVCYLFLALLITTIVKRLKAHTLASNLLVVHMYKKAVYIISSWQHAISINAKATLQLLLVLILFLIAQITCYAVLREITFLYVIACITLLLILCLYLLKFYIDVTKVIQGTHEIVDGNLNSRIPCENLSEPVNQLAADINNIRSGFSKAVDDQIKSERLKTELITNVSHDIKTPLTSIINYVDLLKKEDIPNEKAQNYIRILTEKSWRLKTLIEDLVEASKASSGAIQMHPEKLNYAELVKQALGEYEDRLLEHQLEPVVEMDENQDLFIYADGRSTFRIIENLLSNVCKYAMPNTRVYIRLEVLQNMILLEIKNVSANKLGMKSDELIERFVRGDLSRNTEGSGLGLSIANSLTTLQKGTFELKIDGDLFKAQVCLPAYQIHYNS